LIAPGDARGFGQALEGLLRDPELRFRLGQNARNKSLRNSCGMEQQRKTVWQPIDNSRAFHLCGLNMTAL
jgi:hypothetical protein